MKDVIDARGLPCPQPVIRAKEQLDAGAERFTIIVDNEAAVENVCRYAQRQGCETSVERGEGSSSVAVTRTGPQAASGAAREKSNVVYINSRYAGVGDDRLGEILMRAFIKTLKEADPRPAKIIFVNSGVFLTTEGSPLIDDLKELEARAVEVQSCGTCLDFYHLPQKLLVGAVSNMYDIVEALSRADGIIRP